jgi:raffinose/stachyose/melibiose transport system permease protein
VILTFIGSFNWFELPYIMAGLEGPPFHTTDVLGLYFYRTAFGTVSAALQDFGRGSALAVLIFLFILGISAWWVRILRKREIDL